MKHWIAIRHGESEANAQGVLSGWRDVSLTEKGRQQAWHLGQEMAHRDISLVVTSDLVRARQTAELAMESWANCNGCPTPAIHLEPRFRERNFHHLSGKSKKELRASGQMNQLLSWEDAPGEIESYAQLAKRIQPAILDWNFHKAAALFTHGGVIRILRTLTDPSLRNSIGNIKIPNAVPFQFPVQQRCS